MICSKCGRDVLGGDEHDCPKMQAGDFVFTREDALKLSRDWQDLEWGKPHRHTRDNIENAIEELCFAMGATVEDVRATWWSRRRPADQS